MANQTVENPTMKFIMNQRALQIINAILSGLIGSGSKIEAMKLYVSPESQLASQSSILTYFGELVVRVNEYAPKGYAYIMGNSGYTPRVFAWVSRSQKNRIGGILQNAKCQRMGH